MVCHLRHGTRQGYRYSLTIRARKAGAKPEEIRHAVIVLTSTIGYPTVAAALSWIDDVVTEPLSLQRGGSTPTPAPNQAGPIGENKRAMLSLLTNGEDPFNYFNFSTWKPDPITFP